MVQIPSLLITDDDRAVRETLFSVFEPRGFRTLLASCGEEAVRIIEREPVHIVLLDMHMPRWTGLQTVERVKQLRASLPCILMSAALDDDIRRQAAEAHVFRVLSKPVGCREITHVVSDALHAFYGGVFVPLPKSSPTLTDPPSAPPPGAG